MSDKAKGPTIGPESPVEVKKEAVPTGILGASQIIVSLISALAWPIAVIYLVGAFNSPISRLIDRSNNASIEIAGNKISLASVAASAAAVGAAASKENISLQQAVQNISGVFSARTGDARPLNQGRILWVDDSPSNNILLINAFQELGIRVIQAVSTEQAEGLLMQAQFDVVISDMDRPPDHEAGKTLLKWMQARALKTPVIIFAGQWAAQNAGQEAAIGALKITNDPSAVYHLALRAIQGDVSTSLTDASPGGIPK